MGESLGLLPRVEKALSALKGVRVRRYVDFGCGDGSITEVIARFVGAEEVYGVDIDGTALAKAVQRGIRVLNLDLSRDEVPLDSASVDLVTAFEVIEHLLNPDNMLREAYRILRPGGYLLITTPNLASWVNRALLLLGYQPYNAEVSAEILAGVPWRAYTFTKPSGHIRPFTLRALRELLTYHGFRVVKAVGAPGVEPRWLRSLDKLFSIKASWARRIIVLASKN